MILNLEVLTGEKDNLKNIKGIIKVIKFLRSNHSNMKINKELKQEINKEWQSAFPQLGRYAQNKLYKVLGTLVIGIELIKVPFMEQYRPLFVIYTLFDKDLNTNLSEEILL